MNLTQQKKEEKDEVKRIKKSLINVSIKRKINNRKQKDAYMQAIKYLRERY